MTKFIALNRSTEEISRLRMVSENVDSVTLIPAEDAVSYVDRKLSIGLAPARVVDEAEVEGSTTVTLKLKNTSDKAIEIRLIPSTNAAALESIDDAAVVIQDNRVVNIKLTEAEAEMEGEL